MTQCFAEIYGVQGGSLFWDRLFRNCGFMACEERCEGTWLGCSGDARCWGKGRQGEGTLRAGRGQAGKGKGKAAMPEGC